MELLRSTDNYSGLNPNRDRVGVIAGNGQLPIDVSDKLRSDGFRPYVIMIKGEADQSLRNLDHYTLDLGSLAQALPVFRKVGVTHVVMAGGISRRPGLTSLRPTKNLIKSIPKIAAALAGSGDDRLLKLLVGVVEDEGLSVLGAHEIVPDILASVGPIAGRKPGKTVFKDINAARDALMILGPFDIGQAAVAVKGRVIAIEGPEGTSEVLKRVSKLRRDGRIQGSGGVLVKCTKPGQERRVDLPSIGPDTVEGAVDAKLDGIAVESGGSLILDREKTIKAARKAGIFIFGLEPLAS